MNRYRSFIVGIIMCHGLLFACEDPVSSVSTEQEDMKNTGSLITDDNMTMLGAGMMAGTDAGMMAGTDAGMMAGTDAGMMAGVDAGMMAGMKAGMMAGTNAGMMAGTNAGMMAGTNAGMMAGTDAGMMAGTDAGMMAGSEAGTEVLMNGDTMPLSCQGEYCPSARLNQLFLPTNQTAASEAGCHLVGQDNGTSFAQLMNLLNASNFNEYLIPNMDGGIDLILLTHLAGWNSGESANNTGILDLQVFNGTQTGDHEFRVSDTSLDDMGEAAIHFDQSSIENRILSTPQQNFPFILPIGGLNIALILSAAELSGLVDLDNYGFSLSQGVLQGYLTEEDLDDLLLTFEEACMMDPDQDFCRAAEPLGGFSAILMLLDGVLTFDALIDEETQTAVDCEEEECNALGICFAIGMQGVSLLR